MSNVTESYLYFGRHPLVLIKIFTANDETVIVEGLNRMNLNIFRNLTYLTVTVDTSQKECLFIFLFIQLKSQLSR